jgi:asparagine synthase (glutamine-hydrolysing)
MKRWRLWSGSVGRAAGGIAAAGIRVLRSRAPRSLRRVSWVGDGGETAGRTYLKWAYYLDEREKEALLPGLASHACDSLGCLEETFAEGERALGLEKGGPCSDLALFLPDNVLAYTDIGSMAEGLEVRVPFLDPDVAYVGLRDLASEDLSFRRPKRNLRRLFSDALPPHVMDGRKKGFNPPLARWMRGRLAALFESSETREFRRDFVDEPALRALREAHGSGLEDRSQELLSVLSAATWYRRWH